MAREFHFQDPGEGIHEGEVLEVLVSKGDRVEEGQNVLVVETDKASFDVSAPFAGTVEDVRVSEGDTVEVGDVLMTIAAEGEEAAADAEDEDDEAREEEERERSKKAEKKDKKKGRTKEGKEERERKEERKEKKEKKEKKKDERQRKERRRTEREADDGEERQADEREERDDRDEGPVPASPATRRVARELDVDLREVRGTGEGGRVLTDDVRAFSERGAEARRRPVEAERASEARGKERGRTGEERKPWALPDFSRYGEVERQPLRSIRRATARRMERSWAEIPHVTHNDVADVTELEAFRRRHAAAIEERGGKLTLTVILMKAVAAALGEFPRFNASLDPESDEIVLKRYCHIGVALDSERGLLVPVVRDVDCKSLGDLAVELAGLAERVRAGEVSREDMTGGSFTITNVGALGGTHFTPIINHPEVAILGVGRARLQAVVRGSLEQHELVPRLLLPLSFGFDHRVNDGADAARFVNRLVEVLADLETLALAV